MVQGAKAQDLILDQSNQSWAFAQVIKTGVVNEYVPTGKLRLAQGLEQAAENLSQINKLFQQNPNPAENEKKKPTEIYCQQVYNKVQKVEIYEEFTISIAKEKVSSFFSDNIIRLRVIGLRILEVQFRASKNQVNFWNMAKLFFTIALLIIIGMTIWTCLYINQVQKEKRESHASESHNFDLNVDNSEKNFEMSKLG